MTALLFSMSKGAAFACSRRQLLSTLAALLILPACKRKARPTPERAFTLYDIAWRCGQRDRLLPLPRDWHRYAAKLAPFAELPNREHLFAVGYQDGFDQHPDEPVSDPILDYDRAFRRGRADAWNHKPAADSTQGYRDGYDGTPHAHGRPY